MGYVSPHPGASVQGGTRRATRRPEGTRLSGSGGWLGDAAAWGQIQASAAGGSPRRQCALQGWALLPFRGTSILEICHGSGGAAETLTPAVCGRRPLYPSEERGRGVTDHRGNLTRPKCPSPRKWILCPSRVLCGWRPFSREQLPSGGHCTPEGSYCPSGVVAALQGYFSPTALPHHAFRHPSYSCRRTSPCRALFLTLPDVEKVACQP